jgi:hypothetical protein
LLLVLAADARGGEILERSIEAHGGLAAFRAVRDWRIVARRRLWGPPHEETYEEYLLNDGAIRTLLIKRRADSLLVFGHDGRRGFSVAAGKLREGPEAEGEAYYRAHGEYYLRALPFKWRDPGVGASYEGEARHLGREVHRVRLTASEGTGVAWKDVWHAVVDKENYLLLEAELEHDRSSQTWMRPRETGVSRIAYRFADHRAVGPLIVPFRMEYWLEGKKTGENVIQEMRLDQGVPRAWFLAETHAHVIR